MITNLFLIGFMGAGKTTVGRIVARRSGFEFCDLDRIIEQRTEISIPQIFSSCGEEFFRDAESEALKSISEKDKQIVATGGGIVLRSENRSVMRQAGTTVYLKAPVEVLYSRVRNDKTRPLLEVDNPLEKARKLLDERATLYEKADLIVETSRLSVDEVAEEIMTNLF